MLVINKCSNVSLSLSLSLSRCTITPLNPLTYTPTAMTSLAFNTWASLFLTTCDVIKSASNMRVFVYFSTQLELNK